MKARTLVFLTILALAAAAPMVVAQATPSAPADQTTPATPADTSSPTIQGSVVSIGNTSMVITADDGTTRTFVIDTATSLPTAEIEAGNRVAVRYKALDADRAQALSVSIEDTPGAGSAPAGSGVPATGETPATSPIMVSPVALAVLGLAALAIVIWVFTHRRNDEMHHITH